MNRDQSPFRGFLSRSPIFFVQFAIFSFWLFMILLPITSNGVNAAELVFVWGTFQSSTNLIFPLTYFMAWASLLYAFYILRSRIRLNTTKAIILSMSVPFAATGLFEGIYQNLFMLSRPGVIHTNLTGEILMLS